MYNAVLDILLIFWHFTLYLNHIDADQPDIGLFFVYNQMELSNSV